MRLIGKIVYHFFNIVFKVILVALGLIILIVGTNTLSASVNRAANELKPGSTAPFHIGIPSIVPEKIRVPAESVQKKIETWVGTFFEDIFGSDYDLEHLGGSSISTEGPSSTPEPTALPGG